MIKITADSTIDLNKELCEKYDIAIIPFVVTLGEETFFDGENVTPQDAFDYFKKSGDLPKTGARSPEDIKEFFNTFTDKGYDVIHIGIGSSFSSGYSNAVLAAQDNPHVKVIDTKTLSSGSGLLAIYASELVKSGKYSFDQIVCKVEKRVEAGQSSFIIEKLKFLYKGGRCSMLSMLGANIMRIKPCIQVVNGENKVTRKYMGNMPVCVTKYINDTLKLYNNPDHTRCMVTYSSTTPEMLEAARTALQNYGKFKEVLFTNAGSVISCHCGENTLGILYINDGDVDHY